MMDAKPHAQHELLQRRLLGDWTFEAECEMGPGEPRARFRGRETIRPLGPYWTIAEGETEMPDGATGQSMITLGFDPARERFTGTWIGSMMSHLWVYDCSTDASGQELTLAAEGPSFTGDGLSNYRDVLRFESDDYRILTASVQLPDGGWHEFMTTRYVRKVG